MYRQSPGRNHRSKGIKVKNVLQICLLLAVCFWLIYQVKHSHDKKKEFDESDAKDSLSSEERRRLGRKDIQTRVGGVLNKDENHDELSDEEEINGEEVDENKHEEDEVEDKKADVKEDDEADEVEDKKADVKEDDEADELEDKKADDETDEHEQEKSDAEVDREEEREDGDENETQNTESEGGHTLIEKESSAEETDHDGDDSATHEAREEHYKADDASSAVTQNQHPENIAEVENKESDNQETFKSGDSEPKEDFLVNSGNSSSPNNTLTQESNDHLMSNTTIEDHGLLSENLTESVSAGGSDLQTIGLERAVNNFILNAESTHPDSNSTVPNAKKFPNPPSSINAEAGNNTETLLENNNEIEGEKTDTGDETSENSVVVQQDAIDISDTSNSLDEKEVRTDLETLPQIQTEGANDEDAAV